MARRVLDGGGLLQLRGQSCWLCCCCGQAGHCVRGGGGGCSPPYLHPGQMPTTPGLPKYPSTGPPCRHRNSRCGAAAHPAARC